MPNLTDTHYSRVEAAQVLGVDPATLDRWRKARKGPPVTQLARNKIFYRKAALMDWLSPIYARANHIPQMWIKLHSDW